MRARRGRLPGAAGSELPEATKAPRPPGPSRVVRKTCGAFPEGTGRDWAAGLAVRRKAAQLARMRERAAPRVADPKRRERALGLGRYTEDAAAVAGLPGPSTGTTGAAAARVGAARPEGRGRSWSRSGAEATCLIRCALKMGRPLVAPRKGATFTEAEREAVLRGRARRAGEIPTASGRGRRPPRSATASKTRAGAGFRARACWNRAALKTARVLRPWQAKRLQGARASPTPQNLTRTVNEA